MTMGVCTTHTHTLYAVVLQLARARARTTGCGRHVISPSCIISACVCVQPPPIVVARFSFTVVYLYAFSTTRVYSFGVIIFSRNVHCTCVFLYYTYIAHTQHDIVLPPKRGLRKKKWRRRKHCDAAWRCGVFFFFLTFEESKVNARPARAAPYKRRARTTNAAIQLVW